MDEKKPIHKQGHAWIRWLKRHSSSILLYIVVLLGTVTIRDYIQSSKGIEKIETESKKAFEEKKTVAKEILDLFAIANQIVLDREKICKETKDPQELSLKLMTLAENLRKNNRKIPMTSYNFDEIFNKNIGEETMSLSQLLQQADSGFSYCEENKHITSDLIQQKRLMLSENIGKYLIEEEKQFTEVKQHK